MGHLPALPVSSSHLQKVPIHNIYLFTDLNFFSNFNPAPLEHLCFHRRGLGTFEDSSYLPDKLLPHPQAARPNLALNGTSVPGPEAPVTHSDYRNLEAGQRADVPSFSFPAFIGEKQGAQGEETFSSLEGWVLLIPGMALEPSSRSKG